MDNPCLWIVAAFWLLNICRTNMSQLVPILKMDKKIINGEDTNIVCTLPTNQSVEVELKILAKENFTECRNDKGPPPSITCSLEAAKKFHEMEVTCEARFVVMSKTEKMYVHSDPSFTDCPNNVTWVEGKEQSFHCKAEGYTLPVVHCLINRTVYKDGEKFNVSRNMAGKHTCKAENSIENVVTQVSVTVEYKPKILKMETLPPSPVPEGERVNLTCESNGIPPPVYSWETPSPDIQRSPDNRSITIQAMNQGHYGTYICTVQNKHGEDKQRQIIAQPVKPKIIKLEVEPESPAPEGENVTLTCEADGLPLPTYTWETPTGNITIAHDSRSIRIQGVKKIHEGNYTCTAHNQYGTDSQRKYFSVSGSSKLEGPRQGTILLMLIFSCFVYNVH
ncbi:hypothetical protein GDO86_006885 [Hymenochirus boettgeri]|uniref:Ig-like domain-containing protein n=1 Tax=Hymenochirus boettgeri TaxID=247094 RepID=A0A8T2JDE7_9PIPI|nr:hypothetical protein GDO86_006885 [Hymenochirus boettgeri]